MSEADVIDLIALPSLALDERRDLPDMAAIYFVLAGDTVLYVGQSISLQQRWVAHHRLSQLNVHGGCRIAWMQVDDVSLLDGLERACIEHFCPTLNNTTVASEDAENLIVTVRLPRWMRDELNAARQGRRVKRSLNAEIVARLDASLLVKKSDGE